MNKYNNIINKVKEELSCSAHSLDHIMRVYNLCRNIAEYEENVDYEVLELAALLHDIARVKEDQDKTNEIRHEVLGCCMAEEILIKEGYDKEKIKKIKECILTHRFRGNNRPESIEAKILFDADKIDAIGAVGIGRSYMLAGSYKEDLYLDVDMDEYIKENVDTDGRLKDFSKHSPNIEYEIKLKHIPGRIHTKRAKEIAKERVEFMSKFFSQIEREIRGER